jgi:glutamyl-Q tRNA(Asp) synthetase
MLKPAYRGRFAPSPTGPLHFGSLVAALASYLEARSRAGQWLMRIDDLDQTRCVPGMDNHILRTLEMLGFAWDGEIVYQHATIPFYEEALQQLRRDGYAYVCRCSRRQVREHARMGVEGPVYPDTCRERGLAESAHDAIRLKTDDHPIGFRDALYGLQVQRLHSEIGDFVIRRADGYFAYQLAVVVDDAHAGITHVVRGSDLLTSTARQIYLQRLLGLPHPAYLHVPLVLGEDGKKLSKRDAAHPVDTGHPVNTLLDAWHFLGQAPAETADMSLQEFWDWATSHWDPRAMKQQTEQHR